MGRRPLTSYCKTRDHAWERMSRGSDRVRCSVCRTEFPCKVCSHLDCMAARDDDMPDWVGTDTKAALRVELGLDQEASSIEDD